MDDNKTGGHAGIAVTVGAVLLFLIYFLLPVVFTVPFIALAKNNLMPRWMGAAFFPIVLLYDRYPAYKALLDVEFKFCESRGWDAK